MQSPWPILTLCAVALASEASAQSEEQDGRALFVAHCAVCHGMAGQGDGPLSRTLAKQPADLTKIAARREGVWPMLEVMAIVDGYTGLANHRENMPVIDDMVEGPMVDFDTGNGLVTRVPARLVATVEYLERIQSPRPERYVP